MSREPAEIRRVRPLFIELLEDIRYWMLYDDEVEAKQTLKRYRTCKGQYDVVDFVLELLRADFPMEAVPLKNTKYRPGTGYVMKRPYGYDIYIKLRLTDSISNQEVHIMSFHPERP